MTIATHTRRVSSIPNPAALHGLGKGQFSSVAVILATQNATEMLVVMRTIAEATPSTPEASRLRSRVVDFLERHEQR